MEAPTLFSSLVGGVVGALAAVDVPAEGERPPRPAPGTDWSGACQKLHAGARELEGFLQQAVFVAGKLALGIRVGFEQLSRSIADGTVPHQAPLDKADVEQSLDAGKQGAELLLRGGKLLLEAAVEAAKVAGTRALIAAEHGRHAVLRSLPHSQEKIAQVYSSFLRGYGAGAPRAVGYGAPAYAAPSYTAPSYQAPSYQAAPAYQAPPEAQAPTGFFW